MSYHLSGVAIDVSQQAVRPREPARPGVPVTLASQMMATRAPRPRETVAPGQVTKALVQQVTSLKGQQVALEKKLAVVGSDLRAANSAVSTARAQNTPAIVVTGLVARATTVQQTANTVIQQIKTVAAQANDAAAGAIRAGATRVEVVAAAAKAQPAIAMTSTPSGVPAAISPQVLALAPTTRTVTRELPATFTGQPGLVTTQVIIPNQNVNPTPTIIRSALPTGPLPGTSSDSVIEAGSVTVLPDGSLLPGPDAQLVLTPTLSDASIQDVTVSSGSLFSMVLAAGGVFLAWKFLSKRGKV